MLAAYLDALSHFSRNVRLCLIATALLGFNMFGGIFTVLFNLYLLRLGYGPEFVGLANATGAMVFALSSVPAIILGGRLGSRRTMIAGLMLCVVGFGSVPGAAFASQAFHGSLLVAAYSLGLLGISLHIVNVSPFLMSATAPDERNHAFSLNAALLPLSGFAGSLVAGFLPGRFSQLLSLSMGDPAPFRYTLFLSAALSAPAIFVVMATREARRTSAERRMARKQAFPTGPILLLSVVSLLQVGGESAARTFFNVYMDAGLSVSTELIGLLVAGGHLLAVPAALAMPVLSSRWSKYWVVVAGAVGMALCLVFMSWIPHWWMAGIGFMVLSALASIRRPAFVVTHQELVPAHWRAAVSGATSMAAGLGYAIVSFGGGYIIASSGYETLFIMGASLAVAGALLFGICFRRTPALPTERPLTSAEDWTGRNRPGGQP